MFASYVVAVLGAVLGLLLIITARFDPAGNSALQGLLSDIFAPLSAAGRSVVGGITGAGDAVGAYINAGSKNRAMANELKAARQKLIQGQNDAREVRRLKALVGMVERLPDRVAVAQLVSSTGSSSRRYATLNAGAANGVQPGQPVRAPEGLVGRVVQVGRWSARVLLITDGGNIIPVQRASDGIPALAYGLGDGRIDLRPLAAGNNPFKVGDIFVTSGTGGIYQPNIPVAIGIKSSRDGTYGRPLANPSQLDYAVVEREFIAPLPPPPDATRQPGGQ
ncbi:MAG: rod shape-determining protein MreC [Sphingomonadaceae bacterium]